MIDPTFKNIKKLAWFKNSGNDPTNDSFGKY